MNPVNSMVISEKDNVATALVELLQGDMGRYLLHGNIVETAIVEDIPQYHKYAICDIPKDEQVRKYGEVIGQAIAKINKGEHVHVHNVEGLRGRGDR